MALNKNKRILLLLPEGTTRRNFLTTGIVENLLEDPDVKITCALDRPHYFSTYINHPRIEFIQFKKRGRNSILNFLLLILRSRFYSLRSNSTLETLKKSTNLYWKENILQYPFPKSLSLYKIIEGLHSFLFYPLQEIRQLFHEKQFDLVFATHLVKRDEYDYLQLAETKNIKTVGMVKSFDNLTGKGFLAFKPKKVIVWNEQIKNELKDLYDYQSENIVVTGIPQFDLYSHPPIISRKDFFHEIGLDYKKKTILYATNASIFGPDDCENVNYIQSHLNKLNAQMIVRLHFDDYLERYPNQKLEDVYFQVPGHEYGNTPDSRVSYKQFISELRDTLFFSDVTINTASTMTLDAIAAKKPIININFDYLERSKEQSIKRYYEFVHYKPIVDFKAVDLANSKEDLIVKILSNLENPELNAAGRKTVEEKILAGNFGDSSRRISDAILSTLME